jgi:glycosyltransferase involved in cell wall biosynthesis
MRILSQEAPSNNLHLVAILDRVGYGYKEYWPDIVERDTRLADRVHFIDPVPEIAPLLCQMQVLAIPSLWEACPLLPMEAMVLGVPVVGSDAIGLREVLYDTPSYTPSTTNAEELARSILSAASPGARQRARSFAPRAAERFRIDASVNRLAEVYQELAR